MRRVHRLTLLLVLTLGWIAPASAFEISPKGHELSRFFNSLDVERHWLPGVHINWYTGDRDSAEHAATHCSAFVASASKRLGVYILRPPQHPQELLANAQYAWLYQHGAEHGWKAVTSPLEAQRLANDGVLVVAAYQSPNPKKPGHIAIVRPSTKSVELIAQDGPQIIQAGGTNHRSTDLKTGFKNHPNAWGNASYHAVRFFVHEIGTPTATGMPVASKSGRTLAAVH